MQNQHCSQALNDNIIFITAPLIQNNSQSALQ